MSETRTQIVLYVVLALVVINLCISSLVLLLDIRRVPGNSTHAPQGLPQGLETNKARLALFDKIKSAYNAERDDLLLEMLDPIVRQKLSKESLNKEMASLREDMGQMQSGVYSHYESIGTTQGIRQFRLFYKVTLEKTQALLEIQVGAQGDEPYRLLGWFMRKQVN